VKIRVGDLRKLVREMLTVSARVGPTGEERGAGLFANAPIQQGQLVSRWMSGLDREFPADYPDSLPPRERKRFRDLASFDGASWFLSGDGGAYFNHSSDPNVRVQPGTGSPATWDRVAARDIAPDEELTMDYGEVGIDDL
jgi:SET domain